MAAHVSSCVATPQMSPVVQFWPICFKSLVAFRKPLKLSDLNRAQVVLYDSGCWDPCWEPPSLTQWSYVVPWSKEIAVKTGSRHEIHADCFLGPSLLGQRTVEIFVVDFLLPDARQPMRIALQHKCLRHVGKCCFLFACLVCKTWVWP